jgi:hypothetical protein
MMILGARRLASGLLLRQTRLRIRILLWSITSSRRVLKACLRRWLHALPGKIHQTRDCVTANHIACQHRLPLPPRHKCASLDKRNVCGGRCTPKMRTVQPLRSREIKAAVASHTQFEHMKKGGQRSSSKPTEGLTFVLQGANKITVPAVFPVTSNVIANRDSPEVPSAAKHQPPKGRFFPELRAMRSAATHNGAVVATAARTGLTGAETRRQDGCDGEMISRLTARTCVQWSKLQGYGMWLVKRASYVRAEKSSCWARRRRPKNGTAK